MSACSPDLRAAAFRPPLAVLEIPWRLDRFLRSRHRGDLLRLAAVCHFWNAQALALVLQRSDAPQSFCAEWGKTKKFSRFCSDAVAAATFP
ncbi:hypothetical protein KCP69_03340 [Salmonella enterica subsp. enterica]|nr:hypothetical protein KCP69_03340 [Salmonella enterica subsp. enterica]